MKKDESENKSIKPLLINIGLGFVTLLVCGSIGYFLILPSLTNLNKTSQEVSTEKARADRINLSVAGLRSQDKKTLATYSAMLKSLIPEQIDMLHFASLNESIAKSVGVSIESIQLSKAVAKNAVPTAGSESKGVQTAPVTILASYKSNFDSLQKLIKAWLQADQEVGIKTVQISGNASGVISYTVTYDLPTSSAVSAATIDDQYSISKDEIAEIRKIQDNIIFTAAPSEKPLGRSNPFLQ